VPPRIDLARIPTEPPLALLITDRGQAFLNGSPIPVPPGQDPYAVVVAHAAWATAQLGRPGH
jgi:hypothetical protein